MTISQASAVNILWDYLTDREGPGGQKRTREDVADALRTLSAPANKALMAGVSPDRISVDAILARPSDEIRSLEVVAYPSDRDGATVVEINYPGHLRVIVGEGAVFDQDTETRV